TDDTTLDPRSSRELKGRSVRRHARLDRPRVAPGGVPARRGVETRRMGGEIRRGLGPDSGGSRTDTRSAPRSVTEKVGCHGYRFGYPCLSMDQSTRLRRAVTVAPKLVLFEEMNHQRWLRLDKSLPINSQGGRSIMSRISFLAVL